MNRHCVIPLALVCALLLTLFVLAGCGGGNGNSDLAHFQIDSANVGDKFEIDVALPKGYFENDAARYDTVYLLDGNWHFTNVANIIKSLVNRGKMQPVILVAIAPTESLQPSYNANYGDPYRERDFTPTYDPTYPGSGHADDFAAFLKNELIPAIDVQYRTNASREGRGMMGHSLNGLFTWYAIFYLHDTFSRFVPASASLWYDKQIFNAYEADYAATHTDLPAEIYSTVGTGEDSDMRDSRDQLVTALSGRGYPNYHIQIITYQGLGHVQTVYPSFEDGLTALY